jgi:hypothetical protein
MLDRHFRLMREDLVGPLRQELKEELKLPPQQCRRLHSGPV